MIGQKGIPATWGGVERHVEELSARLARRGHEVTVFVRPSYTGASGVYRGVCLRRLPSVPTKHLDAITHSAACTAAALFERYDILHYHAVGPTLVSLIPRLLGARIVATVHGMDWRRAKWGRAARLVLRCGALVAARVPSRTIVVSEDLRQYMARQGRRAILVPNGVADIEARPLDSLRHFGLDKRKYVLWMGRFTPEKRVEDIVCAFRRTKLDARLLLAGEAPAKNDYVRSVRRAASGDRRIVFAGGLYGGEKAEALTNAALAVVCSELEGMPISALEAMKAGLCVIASDIRPMREIIEPGRTGILYPLGDADALGRAIEHAFADPKATAALGAAAREAVGRRYDWDAIAEQTEKVYEAAMGGR